MQQLLIILSKLAICYDDQNNDDEKGKLVLLMEMHIIYCDLWRNKNNGIPSRTNNLFSYKKVEKKRYFLGFYYYYKIKLLHNINPSIKTPHFLHYLYNVINCKEQCNERATCKCNRYRYCCVRVSFFLIKYGSGVVVIWILQQYTRQI